MANGINEVLRNYGLGITTTASKKTRPHATITNKQAFQNCEGYFDKNVTLSIEVISVAPSTIDTQLCQDNS